MKVVEFKESNTIYAKDQPGYLPLPCHKDSLGVLTSCWKLSFVERIKTLMFGNIYLQVMTFNKPLQPLKMDVYNSLKNKRINRGK